MIVTSFAGYVHGVYRRSGEAKAASANEIAVQKPGTDAGLTSFDELTESSRIADVHYGVLVILALSSLTVYGLIIAG